MYSAVYIYGRFNFRKLGKSVLELMRSVGILVPDERVLRVQGDKWYNIPPRILSGFIDAMVEMAAEHYGSDPVIVANDERKVCPMNFSNQ